MAPVDALLSLCIFWSALHACKHLVARFPLARSSRELTRSRAVLPLDSSPAPRISSFSHFIGHKAARIFHELQLNVHLTTVSLRVETTILNSSFDKASTQIAQTSPHSYSKIKNLSRCFYSLGPATGLFGMALGYMLLFWSCLMVFRDLGPAPAANSPSDEDGPLSSTEGSPMGGTGLTVQPIIPGVTVPLSHVPILLGALLANQVIHEAGHAFTAVIEGVPIHSVGVGFFVCLPMAFVALSSTFDRLPPVPRMRIAAAGAYHNLVLWLMIGMVGWLGISEFMSHGWTGWGTPLGPYRPVDDLGVAIRSVEQDSDLSYHLFPGDIITRIEDTVLSQAHLLTQRRTPLRLWHDLLLHHHYNATIDDLPDMGWCVDKRWYEGQPTSCCTQSSPSSLVCFAPTAFNATGRCLDAFKVFDPPETPMAISHGRCASRCITADAAAAEDEPDQVCVRAKGITRIGVVRNGEDEKIVLWSGPSEEIWEQGKQEVSDIAPRYWFIPLGLPELVSLFVSYTSTITLSLFFLNLLPIRALDGTQFLRAFLDIYGPQPSALAPSSPGPSIEEGSIGYQFAYESSTRRPRVLRRHTLSSRSQASILHIQDPGGTNWIATNRAVIERLAEATAIGLVAVTAAGNAWILFRSA
ncbi:hypothetical protein RSAG8_07953, partial [Rhizoctonia solani AG-8 WAC10335]